MRVKMLQQMVGPRAVRSPGDVLDLDDAEARRLLAAGYAELVPPEVETADAGNTRRRAVARG
ncbi:MAG: hypothetical protein AB7F67_03895 [Rhodospirillaceae bacterium]